MIMVSVGLPSDTLLQHLPSYLAFSYLGRGVPPHGCSSKVQPLLLTLDEGCLHTAAPPDLEREFVVICYDSPKKLICMCVLSYFKLCSTLCDPMDCSPPNSSVHRILQARIVEWVAMPSSRVLPDPGIDSTSLMSPPLAGGFFTTSATWEALKN